MCGGRSEGEGDWSVCTERTKVIRRLDFFSEKKNQNSKENSKYSFSPNYHDAVGVLQGIEQIGG